MSFTPLIFVIFRKYRDFLWGLPYRERNLFMGDCLRQEIFQKSILKSFQNLLLCFLNDLATPSFSFWGLPSARNLSKIYSKIFPKSFAMILTDFQTIFDRFLCKAYPILNDFYAKRIPFLNDLAAPNAELFSALADPIKNDF